MYIPEGRNAISPAHAQDILNHNNYARQRRVYSHHVRLLADQMRRGNWTPGSQIAFAEFGERLYLVNGQHRLHAVVSSGRGQEFQVLVQPCQTMDTVDELYHRFDVSQRARSTTEILDASRIEGMDGLSKAMRRATFEAVAILNNGMRRPHFMTDPVAARSIDERLEQAADWWPIALGYESAIKPAPGELRKKLRTSGITAVALATLAYQPATAWDFWRGIAENDGLRKGDPRRAMHMDMLTRRYNQGAQDQPIICASLAWNAFFAGRSLKIIKVAPNARVHVDGTPYNGRV